MQVTVRFFTVLREITEKQEETLHFAKTEKVTVNTILRRLGDRYGKMFADYVYDQQSGAVKGFLQFFINGQSASAFNGLETQLQEGDILAIVPPVGGG